MLRALTLSLSARGYDVSTAEDGARGLSQVAELAPDVIVLDLGLPDLDGMNIIRAVRGYSRTPIVVLSGRSSSRDKVDALEAGADDYVTKPFNVNELVARLRAATRRAGIDEMTAPIHIGPSRINLAAKTVERTGADGEPERVTLASAGHFAQPPRPADRPEPAPDRTSRSGRTHRGQLPADLHGPAAAQARTRTKPPPAPADRTRHGLPLPAMTRPIAAGRPPASSRHRRCATPERPCLEHRREPSRRPRRLP